jgi:hypothetical protein
MPISTRPPEIDVDRGGDLGQVGRVAVAHAGAHLAEPHPLGGRASAAISVQASWVASSVGTGTVWKWS